MGGLDAREKRILLSTCYGHFMSHFNMLVFPAVVIPLTGALGMDMGAVLRLSFWMYLLFGVTALPWGLAADRWGARPLMRLFYIGTSAGAFAAAFWIDHPVGLSLSLAVIGLFAGIYHPAGLGIVAKEIRRVSLGMGYNGMFGNLGLATAPLITGLVNWVWGPQAAYLALGLMNLTGLGLMGFFPESPSGEGGSGGASKNASGVLRAFLILLVAMMLGGIAYRGATVITPAYFELKNGEVFQGLSSLLGGRLSENLVATASVSFIYLVGMIGQFTGGKVADRFELKRGYLVFHLVTIPAAFLMAVVANVPLLLIATVYFFFLLGMQPIENTLVARYTPRRLRHSAFGTKFILTFGVGSLAVMMVGAIENSWGIDWVFPVLGMVSVALVTTIVFLIRFAPK
ncbi:MAG: MFS transporter [Desulfobacteraceae bacterium]|nr:MFS transporter [Desulfobacteraceae bacterium]